MTEKPDARPVAVEVRRVRLLARTENPILIAAVDRIVQFNILGRWIASSPRSSQ